MCITFLVGDHVWVMGGPVLYAIKSSRTVWLGCRFFQPDLRLCFRRVSHYLVISNNFGGVVLFNHCWRPFVRFFTSDPCHLASPLVGQSMRITFFIRGHIWVMDGPILHAIRFPLTVRLGSMFFPPVSRLQF